MRMRRLASSFSILLLAAALPLFVHAKEQAPKLAKPESVGFSSEGIKKLEAGMQEFIDKKQLAGLVTLLVRHGEVVEKKAYGFQDADGKKPMQVDTIARIYSMTKPVTGVAMMMLYEEGKWKPSDPLSKYIPEFANLKVYAGEKDGQPVYEAPKHAPTIGELMSHNAGFTYGSFGDTPVDKMYVAANPFDAPSLQGFIEKMAKLPLLYQPGEKWVYSVSVDIQGHLVEKLSGKTFPAFLQERIFAPLAMKDTGFFVPAEKVARVSNIFAWDQTKSALVIAPFDGVMTQPSDPSTTKMPAVPSGGGGLYSTILDYHKFTQMLANGGELDGTRLLKASSVAMMRTNVLGEQTLNSRSGAGFAPIVPRAGISPAQGFGYDFAVVSDPTTLKTPVGKGTYWWWGVAGTWFWIDPSNDVVFIGIIQRRGGVPGAPDIASTSRKLVYDALVRPEM